MVLVNGDSSSSPIEYTTVKGFFLQDEPETDPSVFDYVQRSRFKLWDGELIRLQTTTNFGLINRTYDTDSQYDPEYKKTQWQRFDRLVSQLNSYSTANIQYKLLYVV